MAKQKENLFIQTLAWRIRKARSEARLSQADLARLCNTTPSAASQWESELEERRTEPTLDKLILIARATHQSLDWLLTGEEFNEIQRRQEIQTMLHSILEEKGIKLSQKTTQKLLERIYQHLQQGKHYSRNELNDIIELIA